MKRPAPVPDSPNPSSLIDARIAELRQRRWRGANLCPSPRPHQRRPTPPPPEVIEEWKWREASPYGPTGESSAPGESYKEPS